MIRQIGNPGIRVYYCRNTAHASEMPQAIRQLHTSEDIAVEAVPCSGRIDPRYLLKAFEGGAKAVCVLACPSGKCKQMEGNLRMTRRAQAVRQLLLEAGLDPDSVQVFVPSDPDHDTLDAAVETVSRAASSLGVRAHAVVA